MESSEWLIGDRRRKVSHCMPRDTPRTRAALVIGSLVGFCVVSIGVAVLT